MFKNIYLKFSGKMSSGNVTHIKNIKKNLHFNKNSEALTAFQIPRPNEKFYNLSQANYQSKHKVPTLP